MHARHAVAMALLLLAACGSSSGPSAQMPVAVGDAPVRGPADAWVTIVEFADFQCPFCGRVQPTLAQLLAQYPADVRLVFKHFPLKSIHPRALPAAVAAECARVQGKFWEMHDLIYAGQSDLSAAALESEASQIGLDMTAWGNCLSDSAPAARVDADEALGVQLGVQGTPTFAINGAPLEGAQPLATFQQRVEAARAAAVASGIPRAQYYDRAVLGH
jgi:protein-disulfide isomerase